MTLLIAVIAIAAMIGTAIGAIWTDRVERDRMLEVRARRAALRRELDRHDAP